MKKIVLIFVALILAAVTLLVFVSPSGLSIGGLAVGSDDRRYVEEHTMQFMEDIKYKDFKKAATFHNLKERKTVDIPGLIERLFGIKPEFIDIMRYRVDSVDLNSTGDRARAHVHVVLKVLNANEIREPDVIYYWAKEPGEGWVMKLESSLR